VQKPADEEEKNEISVKTAEGMYADLMVPVATLFSVNASLTGQVFSER